jgi:uncharacterized protein
MGRFVTAIVLTAALAASAHAQSFDCAKATSPAERLICVTPILGDLDVTMTNLYRAALNANPTRVAGIRREQTAWWRRREACADDAACIEEAEISRIAELKVLIGDSSPAPTLQPMAKAPNICARPDIVGQWIDDLNKTYQERGYSVKVVDIEVIRTIAYDPDFPDRISCHGAIVLGDDERIFGTFTQRKNAAERLMFTWIEDR